MELNVGDKIFIREDLVIGGRYGSITWDRWHISGESEVVGVEQFNNEKLYRIKANNGCFLYSYQMINRFKTKILNGVIKI